MGKYQVVQQPWWNWRAIRKTEDKYTDFLSEAIETIQWSEICQQNFISSKNIKGENKDIFRNMKVHKKFFLYPGGGKQRYFQKHESS